MKKIFFILIVLPAITFGQTRNIVPRAHGEGNIGLSTTAWNSGSFNALKSTNIYNTGNITTSSISVTGALGILSTYGITAGSITLTSGGQINIGGGNMFTLPTTFGSSVTFTNNAFSVGGSTLVVSNGQVAIGGTSNTSTILSLTGSLSGNTLTDIDLFNSASTFVANTGHAISFRAKNGAGTAVAQAGIDTYWSSITSTSTVFTFSNRVNNSYGERMRLGENGGLGINQTSPAAQLDIKSKSAATGYIFSISSQTGTTGELLSVMGSGNVGIGTINPIYKIHESSGVFYNDGAGAGITTTGNITAVGVNLTGALTSVGSGGIAISTSTASTTSLKFRGFTETLSTQTITTGEIWGQTSDFSLWLSTRTIIPADGDLTCAGTVCYKQLTN